MAGTPLRLEEHCEDHVSAAYGPGTTNVYASVHSKADSTVVPRRRAGHKMVSHRAMDVRGTGQNPQRDTRRAIPAQHNCRPIWKRIGRPSDVEGRRSWHFADQPALSVGRRRFVGHGSLLPISKFCRVGFRQRPASIAYAHHPCSLNIPRGRRSRRHERGGQGEQC